MEEQYPCKVIALSIPLPGEQGSDHVNITAKDVFTNRQHVGIFSKSDVFPRPIISETEVTTISYNDSGDLKIMMPDGSIREDLKLPTEAHLIHIANRIKQILDTTPQQECSVTIQKWGDIE